MLIHFEVNAYLDWAPVPPGTKITQADIDAKRVKEDAPGEWVMRVTPRALHLDDKGQRIPDVEVHGHTQTMHEAQIVDRLVVLAMCGKGLRTRAQVAVECIGYQLVEHLESDHIDRIELHDEGPDEAMVLAKIKSFGERISPELAEKITQRYMATGGDPKDPSGILTLLNAMHLTPKPAATAAKEQP